MGSPRALTSFCPLTVQPASPRSRSASRTPSRMLPLPSVVGGWYSFVNTSSGTLPRNGSRTFSSSPLGRPLEASSEFEK